MVDEFQNEQQEQETNVGDRVRESVAELCGALDELIEEEDAISNGRASVPSLREQLVDSWQGKSYYERLQNVVDADAVRTSLFFPLDWGGVLFRSRMLAAASSVPNILTHPPTRPRTHAPRQEQRKKAPLSSADSKNKPRKKQPLSSINLNSANYTADGVRVMSSSLSLSLLSSSAHRS